MKCPGRLIGEPKRCVPLTAGSLDEDYALFLDSSHYVEWLYGSGTLKAIYRTVEPTRASSA